MSASKRVKTVPTANKEKTFASFLTKHALFNPSYKDTFNYTSQIVKPSKYPNRNFCKCCQSKGIYRCPICADFVCGIRCNLLHKSMKCTEKVSKRKI